MAPLRQRALGLREERRDAAQVLERGPRATRATTRRSSRSACAATAIRPCRTRRNVALLERIVADQRAIIAEDLNPDVARGPAGLGALQGSAGLLRARHARARRRAAALVRRQLRQHPPPAHARGAQAPRRRGHLLSLRLRRQPAQLQVDQRDAARQGVGADAPRVEVRGHAHVDRERGRPEADGSSRSSSSSPTPGIRRAGRPSACRSTCACGPRANSGPSTPADIADIVAKYTKYNGRRKPELLEPDDLQPRELPRGRDASSRTTTRSRRAPRRSERRCRREYRDAFYRAGALPGEGRRDGERALRRPRGSTGCTRPRAAPRRTTCAARVRKLFALDAELTRQYPRGHRRRQVEPDDVADAPRLHLLEPAAAQRHAGGLRGPGTEGGRHGRRGRGQRARVARARRERARLPPLECSSSAAHISRSSIAAPSPSSMPITASEPWITGHTRQWRGRCSRDACCVDAAGMRCPPARPRPRLPSAGPEGRKATVQRAGAQDAARISQPWRCLHRDLGRRVHGGRALLALRHRGPARMVHRFPTTGARSPGMTTEPVDAPAADARDGMRLEYAMHLFSQGPVKVLVTLAPTQKFQAGPGLRYAISFDDEAPQVVNVHADESKRSVEPQRLRRRHGAHHGTHASRSRQLTRSSSGRSTRAWCCRRSWSMRAASNRATSAHPRARAFPACAFSSSVARDRSLTA